MILYRIFIDFVNYVQVITLRFFLVMGHKRRSCAAIKVDLSKFLDEITLKNRIEAVDNNMDFYLVIGLNSFDVTVDPVNHKKIINLPYFLIKPHRYYQDSDIKVIWDKCRGYELPILALKDMDKAKKRILSFKTQFYCGIVWSSPMEVSFRVINIFIAYANHKSIPLSINYILLEHYAFLKKNLEIDKSGHTNNHFLSNLVALALIERYLLKFNKYQLMLMKEIKKQFCLDGSNFEGSSSYHFLGTELIFWFYVLAGSQSISLQKHLQSALSVCELLLLAGGKIPLIGDNDSGAVTKLYVPVVNEERVCYKRSNNSSKVEKLWDYGSRLNFMISLFQELTGLKVAHESPILQQSKFSPSTKLPKHKVEVLELELLSAISQVHYLKGLSLLIIKTEFETFTFKCGPKGQLGKGGHDHHDQLSVTYHSEICNRVILDRGTCSYKQQDLADRHIEKHNSFIDKRQIHFNCTRPFQSLHPCGQLVEEDGKWTGIVEYAGFIVARELALDNKKITITDYFEDEDEYTGPPNFDLYHFPAYGMIQA